MEPGNHRRERISDFSDAYLAHRQELGEDHTVTSVERMSFGSEVLEAKSRFDQNPETKKELERMLKGCRKQLAALLLRPVERDLVTVWIAKDDTASPEPLELEQVITHLSDEQLIQLLQERAVDFEIQTKEARRLLEHMKPRIAFQLKDLFSQLGVKRAEAEIDYLLTEPAIMFQDALAMDADADRIDYDIEENTITLDPFKSEEVLYQNMLHEFLHVVSGRTVEQRSELKEAEEDDGDESDLFFESRFGWFMRTDDQKHKRFYWLNEAITEHLTAVLAFGQGERTVWDTELILTHGTRPETTYESERALLFALLTRGNHVVDFKSMLSGFFESYEPGKDVKQQQFLSLREAVRSISQAWGPGMLGRLDQMIAERGVDGAIQYIETLKVT